MVLIEPTRVFFFHILESAQLATNFFMVKPNISTFIYILDATCVSSIYKHLIYPKLAFSSDFFDQMDAFGFFI